MFFRSIVNLSEPWVDFVPHRLLKLILLLLNLVFWLFKLHAFEEHTTVSSHSKAIDDLFLFGLSQDSLSFKIRDRSLPFVNHEPELRLLDFLSMDVSLTTALPYVLF